MAIGGKEGNVGIKRFYLNMLIDRFRITQGRTAVWNTPILSIFTILLFLAEEFEVRSGESPLIVFRA